MTEKEVLNSSEALPENVPARKQEKLMRHLHNNVAERARISRRIPNVNRFSKKPTCVSRRR
ncbi:MAG: hypothetical protein WC297_03060 [Candidatus Paceibacterota bacterium]